MAKGQRDVAKEAYWRKVLKQFSASGLSVREFCKREQLTESAFYAWRRTIGERNDARTSGPAFVPAVVTKGEKGDITDLLIEPRMVGYHPQVCHAPREPLKLG